MKYYLKFAIVSLFLINGFISPAHADIWTWTKQTQAGGYSGSFNAIAYNGSPGAGLWTAVGDNGEIQTSNNGTTWTHQTPALIGQDYYSGNFYGVAYNGSNLWVAVGSPTQGGAAAEIQTSPDGVNWTRQTPAGGYIGNFYGVAYNGSNLWTAVGGNGGGIAEIETSPDGITWTKRTAAGSPAYSGNFYGVAYNGSNLWTAVGASGEIETSENGNLWTKRTQAGGYAGSFRGIAYGSNLWTAVGSSSNIETSPDGITWTQRIPAEYSGGYLRTFYDIAYGSNLWTAVENRGKIETSPDGITWTYRTQAGGYEGIFYGIAYGSNLWVAVGSGGEIETSLGAINANIYVTATLDGQPWPASGSDTIVYSLSGPSGNISNSTVPFIYEDVTADTNYTLNYISGGPVGATLSSISPVSSQFLPSSSSVSFHLNFTSDAPDLMTIVATSVVCNSETDLPNWDESGQIITSSTMSSIITSHPNCYAQQGQNFQWAPPLTGSPSGTFLGEAGTPWITFGPTDNSGVAQTSVDKNGEDITTSVWIREVLQPGYLTFSGPPNPSSNISAEIWCWHDVLNYDNYDRVDFTAYPDPDQIYYCIAFNVGPSEPFDYSLSNSGTSNVIKTDGDAFTQNTITKTLTSGMTQLVTLSLTGHPSPVTYSISPNPSSPTPSPGHDSTITFTVPSSAPTGTFPIVVTGSSPLGNDEGTNLNLVIEDSLLVSCSASPSPTLLGQTVTWTATVSGGTPPFIYSWSGTNIPTSPAPDTNPFSISYGTIGQKNAVVTVTDSPPGSAPLQNTCPVSSVRVNFNPRFEEF